jgi:TonB-linked SusC/RagA family outer membrane protein
MQRNVSSARWSILLLLLVILPAMSGLMAQKPATSAAQKSRTFTGKVTNVMGDPMEDVSVKVKGQTKGVRTNDQGVYVITLDNPANAVLVFSYVGSKEKEVKITATGSVFNVQLESSIKDMDEVLVVGYGTVRKRDLTGAVGKVNIGDIQKAPVPSFEDALAGRVAGVQVSSIDGQPGASNLITIRGGNSITQSNAPLYVIDGFPIENPDNNTLNPDEIESIQPLLDASATAIYGARGANGVFIITTKKGKAGAPVVTYNGWYGLQKTIKRQEVMSTYEFVKYQYDLSPITATATYLQDGKTLESYRGVQGVNWQDKILRTAPMQSNSLSISGGNDKTRYSVSGSVFNQDGILINGGFRRLQGRMVLDQTVSDKVKVGINVNYSNTRTNGQVATNGGDNAGSSTAYLFFSGWGYRPVSGTAAGDESLVEDPFDPAGNTTDSRVNPFISSDNAYNYTFVNALLVNAYAEYKVMKNVTLRVTGGITKNDRRREVFNNSKTAAGNPKTVYGSTNGLNGSLDNYGLNSWLNENTLTYNKKFNASHTLNVVGGFTLQRTVATANGFTANQLPNENIGINGLDEGNVIRSSSSSSESALASFLGRVNYTFKSKYLFTVSMRADGSSKFMPENRWGYFPSGAFAWRLSDEKFMKKLSFISDAKFRTSYGLTGNNRVSDFSYRSILTVKQADNDYTNGSGNSTPGYYFNNVYVPGSIPTDVGNTALKWERTAQTNIGLDLSFLQNRISLTTDFYYKKTTDLLINATLVPSSGYLDGYKNIGAVSNKGVEFTVNTVNVQRKAFTWTSSFNISFNKNKVLELNDNQPSLTTQVTWNANFNTAFPYIAKPGMPVALFYGFLFDGLYQYSDFDKTPDNKYVLKATVPTNNGTTVQPGYTKYKDINGDGKVDGNDLAVIGNPNPKFYGGFSNNFAYKNFDLNVFFQWSYGNDILNANRIVFEGAESRLSLNMFKSMENRWSSTNQNSLFPAAGGYGPNVYSSRTIEDGSFLRLKTVALGYTLPADVLKRIKIAKLRFYASAQNLITWTKYSGIDPEVSVRNSALTPGFDWSAYPKARTITVGVNLTF